MHPILFEVGPFSLKTYGLFIVLAFFAAFYYIKAKSKKSGFSGKFVYDLGFYSLVAGLIGARLTYVLLDIKYYLANPLEILMVWNGGLVFFGGLAGGLIGGILTVKYYKAASWKQVADIASPAVALAHSIGRVGCFFAGCCYGKETSSCIGVVFNNKDTFAPIGVKLLPVQLIESAGDFGIFIILNIFLNKNKRDGNVLLLYILLYGCFRFIMEFLRGDFRGLMFGGFSMLAIFSLLIACGSLYLLIKNKNAFK